MSVFGWLDESSIIVLQFWKIGDSRYFLCTFIVQGYFFGQKKQGKRKNRKEGNKNKTWHTVMASSYIY